MAKLPHKGFFSPERMLAEIAFNVTLDNGNSYSPASTVAVFL